jgi:hypothetical protein
LKETIPELQILHILLSANINLLGGTFKRATTDKMGAVVALNWNRANRKEENKDNTNTDSFGKEEHVAACGVCVGWLSDLSAVRSSRGKCSKSGSVGTMDTSLNLGASITVASTEAFGASGAFRIRDNTFGDHSISKSAL